MNTTDTPNTQRPFVIIGVLTAVFWIVILLLLAAFPRVPEIAEKHSSSFRK